MNLVCSCLFVSVWSVLEKERARRETAFCLFVSVVFLGERESGNDLLVDLGMHAWNYCVHCERQ